MGQPKPVNLDDDFEDVFADELEEGHQLMQGQYTIESFLNAGGFGITYRAKDSLDRPVVIKECFPGSFCRRTTTSVQPRSRAHKRELSSIVGLFVQEARSLARLNHPNIVGVHQVFEENNTAYMALDFVEGRDLLDMIEEPTDMLEPDQVEEMLGKLLDAVGFIHGQGVLHRDISPDNILLKPDQEPILIDFGAAREEASKQSRVLSALRVVKDGYSPQEFYISGSEQGPFSDLYALGATFYHLITGELPANSQARLAAVASGDADPYHPVVDRMPAYSERFLKAIDKSLAILPKDRIESAEQWVGLLDGSLDFAAFESPEVKAKRQAAQTEAKRKSSMKPLLLASVALMVPFAGYLLMSQGGSSEAVPEAPVAEAVSEPVPDVAVVEPEPEINAVAAALAAQAAANAAAAEPASEAAVVPEAESALEAALGESTSSLVLPDPAAVVSPIEEITAPAFTEAYISAPATEAVAEDAAVGPVFGPVFEAPTAPLTVEAIDIVESASVYAVPQSYDFAPGNVPDQPVEAPAEIAVNAPETLSPPEIGLAAGLRPKLRPEVETSSVNVAVGAETDVTLPILSVQPSAEAATADPAPVVDVSVAPLPLPVGVDPALLEIFDLPEVLSGWTVELPGALTDGQGSVFAVNGIEVASLQDLDSIMSKNFAAPLGTTSDVDVLSGATRSDAQVQTVTAPVLQRTLFLNGLFFETRQIDGAWVTTVVTAPEITGMEFRAGDVIVGDLATGTPFDKRTSLPDLLTFAQTQNRDVLTLAVRRDGQVLTLDLEAPE